MEYEFKHEKYCIIDTLDYNELLFFNHQVGKCQQMPPTRPKMTLSSPVDQFLDSVTKSNHANSRPSCNANPGYHSPEKLLDAGCPNDMPES